MEIISEYGMIFMVMAVIGFTGWTGVARLVRGEFLKQRKLDYVTAGKAVGASNLRIIFAHFYFLSADLDSLGAEIKKFDIFGHLLSVHNRTGDDQFKDKPYTDYGILQGPKTTDRKKLSRGVLKNHHPNKPLYVQETLWPGNKHHPKYSDTDIRKNAYALIMSATAINFADMNGDSSSGFSGSMDFSQKTQKRHDIIKRVWDFFETLPFWRMSPRQDLVDNGYCLAEPGRKYLVYLESPGKVIVKITPGRYSALWIDAQNTTRTIDAGTIEEPDSLKSPPNGDDWLLYLKRLP